MHVHSDEIAAFTLGKLICRWYEKCHKLLITKYSFKKSLYDFANYSAAGLIWLLVTIQQFQSVGWSITLVQTEIFCTDVHIKGFEWNVDQMSAKLSSTLLQHSWFKWIWPYQTLAELDNELSIWIMCKTYRAKGQPGPELKNTVLN